MKKICSSSLAMIKVLIAVFIIIFLSDTFLFNQLLFKWGALHSHTNEYWRILTAPFIHTSVIHLLGNCLIFWYIGHLLNKQLTGVQVLVIFMLTNLITYSLFMNVWVFTTSVGASPGIYGCIAVWFVHMLKRRPCKPDFWLVPRFYFLVLYLIIPQFFGFASCFVHGVGFLMGILFGFIIKGKMTPS